MQKTGTTGRMLNTVFVLLLFCVFAMAVLMTLFSGAGAYQSVHDHLENQYVERTGLSYLEAKLHHYDKADAVHIEPFADGMALALYEQIEGTRYKTLIYCYDGYIRELFFEDGLVFLPSDGQPVLAAEALSFAWKTPQLLQIVCEGNQDTRGELMVYIHSGEEVALDV